MTLLVSLDLESTGLDTQNDRIVEVCALVYRLKDRKLLLDFTRRVDPDGVKIAAAAQKVHGISALDLVGAPKFAAIMPQLLSILNRADLMITFNGESFDVPMLIAEIVRAGGKVPETLRHFDMMRESMAASFDDKPPSLRELCWALEVEYDPAKAHAAFYDTDVMTQCFFRGLDAGYYKPFDESGVTDA